MDKPTLLKNIVTYLQLSSMESKEKAMWFLFLPHLRDEELTKLHGTLEKEVSALTDLYLKALSQNI